MARINSAVYNNEEIDAFEVDDNYGVKFVKREEREKFRYPECSVKIQFNRGINEKDPHFKNWPKIEHHKNCGILQNYLANNGGDNSKVDVVISTILPRAERLINLSSSEKKTRFRNRYFGKRSKTFLNALISLDYDLLKELTIRTEDKRTIRVVDLIFRQDDIINEIDSTDTNFVAILKGFTTKHIRVGNSIKIPMTSGGKYGNSKDFDLFIPASYLSKNEKFLEKIEKKLIYCYGVAERNEYGYKMDLFSISHQLVVLPTSINY